MKNQSLIIINQIKEKQKSKNGITLIALVITIIVLLILAGISINALFGQNGLIVKSQMSSFATEMQKIKENVVLKQNRNALYVATNEETSTELFDTKFQDTDITVLKTLKQEILYTRAGYPSDKEPSDYTEEEYEELSDKDLIYLIDKDTGDGKENTYIYDKRTAVVFKIPATRIGGKTYHSYEIAQMQKGNSDSSSSNSGGGELPDQIATQESGVVTVGDDMYYAPNMKGFNNYNTSLVYYSADFSKTQEVNLKTYLEDGEQYQITGEDGGTYTLHNMGQKIWANAKTDTYGLEMWWVWIPRYAYKINGSSSNPSIDVIYVGLDGKPLNKEKNGSTLPEGYEVHPGFTVDGKALKGIWIAKYEPSHVEKRTVEGYLAPDMTGFDPQNTYIELYDSSSNSFKENDIKLADANLNTINNSKEWYDYENKIWANIKTTANEQEMWWVWIPRYAYKITENYTNTKEMSLIFVDLNNKPINTTEYPNGLPEGYEVHPAFTVDGTPKKGIWISKYEPSYISNPTSGKVLAPDMTGFDPQNTYIELYDSSSNAFKTNDVKLADADLNTINNNKEWYDYENKIWANIKTNANGLEMWWVWIPRYAYKITNYANTKEASIIFVGLDNKPLDTARYPNGLPEGYELHPGFTVGGVAKKGIWIAKYEPSYTSDIEGKQASTTNNTFEYADDTAGTKHTHDNIGAGTTERYVTSSTSWCTGYDGTPCNNYGYYRYCSKCGVKLRYYWCKNHVTHDDKVWIDDSDVE